MFASLETPSIPLDRDAIERYWDNEYVECDKMLSSYLKSNRELNLKAIEMNALAVVTTRTHGRYADQSASDRVYSYLVGKQIFQLVASIEVECQTTIDTIISKLTTDPQNWCDLFNDIPDIFSKNSSDNLHAALIESAKQFMAKKSNKSGFFSILQSSPVIDVQQLCEIVENISNQLIMPLVNRSFKHRQVLEQSIQEVIPVFNSIVKNVITKFTKSHSTAWKRMKAELDAIKESLSQEITSRINKSIDQNPHASLQQKQEEVKNQFLTTARQMIGKFLFDPMCFAHTTELENQVASSMNHSKLEIARTVTFSAQDFKQNIVFFESSFNPLSFSIAELKSNQLLGLLQFLLSTLDAKNQSNFGQQESMFVMDSLSIFFLLMDTKDQNIAQQHVQELLISSTASDFNATGLIRNDPDIFIRLLETKINNKQNSDVYLVMTYVYLIISNIQVNPLELIVNVKPYYGFLMNWRTSLLKMLSNNSNISPLNLGEYFDFLDTYFEDNLIYQFSPQMQTGWNLFKKGNFQIVIDKSAQDYMLCNLLRREIRNQTSEYPKQVENEFYRAISFIQDTVKMERPKLFSMQKLSDERIRSRNIIIVVSGFTSKEENKKEKWSEILNLYPNAEIYTLLYECKSVKEIQDHALGQISEVASQNVSLTVAVGNLVIKNLMSNPFLDAFEEANKTGVYLAELLHRGNLFPNSSISFIGFSLGTQVIFKCLDEYSKLLKFSKNPSIIDSVTLMGSVVCLKELNSSSFLDAIGQRFNNVFSKNDQILNLVLRATKRDASPIGLQTIHRTTFAHQKKLRNHDFSHSVKGHEGHMKEYPNILQTIKFKMEYQQ